MQPLKAHTNRLSLSDPERDAIRNQQWQNLWRAVRNLPVIDRQIVMLRLEGLSMAEIAEVTGFSEAAVAMRFSRLRAAAYRRNH